MKKLGLTYLAVFLPFLLSASSVFSISIVISQLTAAFNAPIAWLLLAIPIDFIGGAIGGVVLGGLADRAGRRLALLASSALFGLGALLASLANSVLVIWMLWFVIGFGVNAQNGVSYAVIVELSRGMRGSIGGAMQGLYFLGLFVDSIIYYYVRYWRLYFAFIGAISLAVSIPLTFFMQETYSARVKRAASVVPRGNLRLTLLFVAYTLAAFMFSVPLSSVAPDIVLLFRLPDWFITFLSLVGFFSFIIAGVASDKFNRALVTIAFALLGLAGAALAMLVGVPIVALPVLYFSSGFFAYAGIWISESYPIEQRATASNFIFLFGRLIGGFSPELVVALSFAGLYSGLAMISIISSAMALASAALLYGLR